MEFQKLRKSRKLEDRSGGSLFYYIKIKIFKIILDKQTIINYNTINNKQHNFKFKNTEDQEK